MIRTVILFMSLFLALLSFSFLSHAEETQTLKTITLDVPGMSCKFCPITIRKALLKVPGVTRAEAEFENKTASVTFDPGKTSVDALIKATAEAGYPSTLKQ